MQGDHVEATLDVRATDDALRRLAPWLALGTPASAHVELHGLLTRAHASARIVAAGGTLDASADLSHEDAASTIAFDARAAVPSSLACRFCASVASTGRALWRHRA